MIGLFVLAAGAFVTAGDLETWCKGNDTRCITYIMGAIDAALGEESGKPPTFCLPKNYNNFEAKGVVMRGLTNSPSLKRASAGSFVIGAMIVNYPCQRQDGQK
jgi:hypothetical protein